MDYKSDCSILLFEKRDKETDRERGGGAKERFRSSDQVNVLHCYTEFTFPISIENFTQFLN